MSKTYRIGILGVLVLVVLLGLLLAAGPASAASLGEPSFVLRGSYVETFYDGNYQFDVPEPGNLTVTGWRFSTYVDVVTPGEPGVQRWWNLYDWDMVLYDQPDGTAGWHIHDYTFITCTVDPGAYWPGLPPADTWLWTADGSGKTRPPTPVHTFAATMTGHNEYAGKTAYLTWLMADPKYTHVSGRIWILE